MFGFRGTIWIVLFVVVMGVALSGCRKSEQGRSLGYQQGVYTGARDQPVQPSTLAELRNRARMQQAF